MYPSGVICYEFKARVDYLLNFMVYSRLLYPI